MKVNNQIKAEITQSYSGIIYDWYYLEIERVCKKRGVSDDKGFKDCLEFLIKDSISEPAFLSFLKFVTNKYFS